MNTDILYTSLEIHKNKIKLITTDGSKFRENCRSEYFSKFLEGVIDNIEKHKAYVGTNVHKRLKSFSYTDLETFNNSDYKNLNPIEEEAVLFTEQLFNIFVKEYMEFLVSYITERLLTKPIVCNSTNKLSNLMFEWELECQQELIKVFNKVLNN